MDIETKDALININRELAELRLKTSRLPVQLAKVPPPAPIVVYEFEHCTEPRRLYLDNREIASHAPGGAQRSTPVAIIERDGVRDCWYLIGRAPQCKTGECANIVTWKGSCAGSCYNLTPCEGGSPFVVRDIDCADGWAQYVGKVVTLAVAGYNDDVEACFEVTEAEACADVREDILPSHVTQSFRNCNECGCYVLRDCDDNVVYLKADLWSHVFLPQGFTGEELIGQWIKFRGICYEIIAFESPCTHTLVEWNDDIATCCNFGFGSAGDCCPTIIQSCNACCYLLTPCPAQEGDPEEKYYRTVDGDPDLMEFVDDEGASNGRTLMLADFICYTVSIPEDCPETGVILGLGTVLEEYDSCAECGITCWKECGTSNYIATYSRMPIDYRDGEKVLKRAEDNKCYTYESSFSNCEELEPVPFTIEHVFNEGEDSCTICLNPRVKLTPQCGSHCSDCEGNTSGGSGSGSDPIVSNQELLFASVGKYVKADGQCYLVEWTTDALTGSIDCWTGPYKECESCRAAPTQRKVVTDIYFSEDGELIKEWVTLEGFFNVCGEGQESIADQEECEEEA